MLSSQPVLQNPESSSPYSEKSIIIITPMASHKVYIENKDSTVLLLLMQKGE
ncbi:MAG: hypothetical protein ACJAZ3_000072 [Sphingobacteriales bacterium]